MKAITNKISTIFFDIDGTLAEETSWLVLTSKLGADNAVIIKYLSQLKKGEIDLPTANRLVTEHWVETGNAKKEIFERIFTEINIRPEARKVIHALGKKYKVIVISGSMDLYVKSIADRLNLTEYFYNSQLNWDENDNLQAIDYIPDQAQHKLNQVNEYAKKHDEELENYAIVGDGDSDEVLLKNLGLPILFPNNTTPQELHETVQIKIKNLNDLLEIFAQD